MAIQEFILEEPIAWVVVTPHADADFYISGIYDNREAAVQCANSTEYKGEIYAIRKSEIESTFTPDEDWRIE